MEFPSYAISSQSPGIVGGVALQYTHNGLDGEFYLGTQSLGYELIVRPIDWRWQVAERWSRNKQNWFDLAFLNDSRIVSVLSLKKQSAVNVYSKILEIASLGLNLRAFSFTLSSDQVEVLVIDDGGDFAGSYSAVRVSDFQIVPEYDFLELDNWRSNNVIDWNLVGEAY